MDTPNGQRWAGELALSVLEQFPTIENYADSSVFIALESATTPGELAALVVQREVVVLGNLIFDGVDIQVDSASEPWRVATVPLDVAAEILRRPRSEVVDAWILLHQKPSIPSELTGLDVLLVDIRGWLQKTRMGSPDRVVRQLLKTPPEGRDWVITREPGKATIRSLPLVFARGGHGPQKVYDPIELLERLEAAT